jgi:hypothetical protein
MADIFVLIRILPTANNLATSYAGKLRFYSFMVLLISVTELCIYAVATIVTLQRYSNPQRRYPGLRFLMVTFLLSALVLVFLTLTAQNVMPIFAWAAIVPGTDTLRILVLQAIGARFLPSSRMWVPWASAAVITVTLVLMITYFLWRVVKERDYADINDVFHEVSIRSPLLGQAKTSLMRENDSARRARKFAFLWIIPAAFSIATEISLALDREVILKDSAVLHATDSGLIANGAFVSLTGFGFFFWRHYFVILLWMQVVNSMWISVTTGAIVLNWTILQRSAAASNREPNLTPIILGSCASLLFMVGSILTALFIRWVSKRLASEINESVQRKMDDIYDQE